MTAIKIIAFCVLLTFISGCAMTQSQALKESEPGRLARYNSAVSAKAEAVKATMEVLEKIDRGGMKVEVDDQGKIKSISYTERLDMDLLAKAMEVPAYKEPEIKSAISELGDFILKSTNLVVPFASIYYGHKNFVEQTRANVEINSDNNAANTSMWETFTSNYTNTSVIDSSNNTTDVSDTLHTSDVSDTLHTSDVSDTLHTSDVSDTTNTTNNSTSVAQTDTTNNTTSVAQTDTTNNTTVTDSTNASSITIGQ